MAGELPLQDHQSPKERTAANFNSTLISPFNDFGLRSANNVTIC
jgi:hypothetical protein